MSIADDNLMAVLVYADGKTLTVFGANGNSWIQDGVKFRPVALLHVDSLDRRGLAAFTRVMVEDQTGVAT